MAGGIEIQFHNRSNFLRILLNGIEVQNTLHFGVVELLFNILTSIPQSSEVVPVVVLLKSTEAGNPQVRSLSHPTVVAVSRALSQERLMTTSDLPFWQERRWP